MPYKHHGSPFFLKAIQYCLWYHYHHYHLDFISGAKVASCSLENKTELLGARSGKYREYGVTAILFSVKNYVIIMEGWGGTLSQCNNCSCIIVLIFLLVHLLWSSSEHQSKSQNSLYYQEEQIFSVNRLPWHKKKWWPCFLLHSGLAVLSLVLLTADSSIRHFLFFFFIQTKLYCLWLS